MPIRPTATEVVGVLLLQAANMVAAGVTTPASRARATSNAVAYGIVGTILGLVAICGCIMCCCSGWDWALSSCRKSKKKKVKIIERPVSYTHTSGSRSAINTALANPAYIP